MIARHSFKAIMLLACAMPAACSTASPPPGSATVLLTPRPSLTVTHRLGDRGRLVIRLLGTADGAVVAKVQWTAPSSQAAEVRVSAADEDKLFARGLGSGTATARFLAPGHQYVFALRSAPNRRVLASAVVQVR